MLQSLIRRDVIKGVAAGLPLAAILADPLLAKAAAAKTETVTTTTEGGRKVNAALALPNIRRRRRSFWSTNGGA